MPSKNLRPFDSAWNRWHASKLSAVAACKYRGFHEFIMGTPAPIVGITAFGQAVHYLFQQFLTRHRSSGLYPFSTPQKLIGAWGHFWWGAAKGEHLFGTRQKGVQAVNWANDDEPGVFYGLGVKVLRQFFDTFDPIRQGFSPLLAEKRFQFDWQGYTISGAIDLLYAEPEGMVILDHKNGLYKPYLLESGLQLTIYQLAYEKCIRPRLPGRPPLKSIRIHDYRGGGFQEAPLRTDLEYGLLLTWLNEFSTYFRSVLTTQALATPGVELSTREMMDIRSGDVSPRLPRGEHCTYCNHFTACRAWELGQAPAAHVLYREKYARQRESLRPDQLRIPFPQQSIVRAGAASYRSAVAVCDTAAVQTVLPMDMSAARPRSGQAKKPATRRSKKIKVNHA